MIKQLPEYTDKDTLRLGFTNCSTENLEELDKMAYTINSCFGIDFRSNKCSEKKLKQCANVKCIIITKVFMIPSKLMAVLARIKQEFPHIKFSMKEKEKAINRERQIHLHKQRA